MTASSWKDQLELHLESWRSAGVEFLPLLPALPSLSSATARTNTASSSTQAQSQLSAPPAGSLRAAMSPPAVPERPATQLPAAPSGLFTEKEYAAPQRTSPPPAVPATSAGTGTSILELPVLSVPIRERALKDLAARVAQCRLCPELVRTRSRTVFGVGPVDAELAVVGEAPGFNEDQQGEPFVGPAGQLLDKMLAACGFRREDVFICNILRCRPPENRPPMPDEASNCRPFLVQTLELIRPKHLCLMGASAAKYLLQVEKPIGALRGKQLNWRGIDATATYHPSYLLRTPAKKADAWQDLQEMLKRMGRTVPKRGE